ncbi:SWI5-dependent HO expression protein 4 [Microbotryomycetes sp. JL221]|nr:SWI5-dependent HO expression protein 4 [Microbotryomycetes sp. JL221]
MVPVDTRDASDGATTSSERAMVDELKLLVTKAPSQVTQTDIDKLILACMPSQSTCTMALAVFAKWLNHDDDNSLDQLIKSLKSSITSYLSSLNPAPAFATLSATLQVAPRIGIDFVEQDSTLQTLLERAVKQTAQTTTNTKPKQKQVDSQLALVDLMSHCAAQAKLRQIVRATANEWLQSLLGQPKNMMTTTTTATPPGDLYLRCTAAIAVTKLEMSKHDSDDEHKPIGGNARHYESTDVDSWSLEQLTKLFMHIFTTTASMTKTTSVTSHANEVTNSALTGSLEGLAYLTLAPTLTIKPMLVKPAFIKLLFNLKLGSRALDYAVATLLDHLTMWPPPPDSDDLKARLRAKTQATIPQEQTEAVSERIKVLVALDPMPLIKQLCASPSLAVRRSTARILLSLVNVQQTRSKLVQNGATKCCLSLLRLIPKPFEPESGDSVAIQALAKILITTNPMLVIGPTPDSTLVPETINNLWLPLRIVQDESKLGSLSLLIKFECLMALTNIASFNPHMVINPNRSKITTSEPEDESNLTIVQDLMLRDHVMIRRASTELLCNVCSTQLVINHYKRLCLPNYLSQNSTKVEFDVNKVRLSTSLQVLIALIQSQDVPTSLASSGALSILVSTSITIGLILTTTTTTSTTQNNTPSQTKATTPLHKLIQIVLDDTNDVELKHRCLDVVHTIVTTVFDDSMMVKNSSEMKTLAQQEQLNFQTFSNWFQTARQLLLDEIKIKNKFEQIVNRNKNHQLIELCQDALSKLNL